MKKISNVNSLSTEIYKEYSSINSIEIESDPFNSGGFGEVYKCLSINGKKTPIDQVIKILFDVNGSSQKGYSTIQDLQKKIISQVSILRHQGKDFEAEYPAMLGCPQFSFAGVLNGIQVVGYSANNLNSLGFQEFDKILRDVNLLKDYQRLPLISKLAVAYQIANGFDLLRKFQYIHADFKSEALFVNLKKLQCAIIDFDSGAVMQSQNDKPTTWGARQDWLAPEIVNQIAIGEQNRIKANDPISVQVDLWSDAWSVAICIHYLIFTCHPFKFFTEISSRSLTEFVNSKVKFPEIPNGFKYFNPNATNSYKNYYSYYKNNIPKIVQEKFKSSFSSGCLNPQRRVTYSQWKLALRDTQKPPKIIFFKADRIKVSDKNPVNFSWKIENATSIFLNSIKVTGKNFHPLQINQDSEISLIVISPFGKVTKKIRIETSKEKPLIKKFLSNVSNNYVQTNKDIILSWEVSNYEILEILGVADVSKTNNFRINAPIHNTTFTLKATTYFGQISQSNLVLTVNKNPPQIAYFSTSQNTVFDLKNLAILNWNVLGAENISIDNGVGDVTNKKKAEVLPRTDKIYTITATSYFGITSRKQLKILVSKAPPTIKNFESNKQLVTIVEDVILQWEVENAEKIFLNQGIGDVTNNNSVYYTIKGDVTFILTAISPFGVKSTSSIIVQTAKVPPTIKSFRSSKNIVDDDKPIVLTWEVNNAESIFIDNGIGDVSELNKVKLKVNQDVAYTLTATSTFGATSNRTIKIQISKIPPRISLFRTQVPLLFEGLSTSLIWQVENPSEVIIDNGIGNVDASGKTNISPSTDKTYTLIARNHFGYESRAHIYIKIIRKPKLNSGRVQLKSIPKLKKSKLQ